MHEIVRYDPDGCYIAAPLSALPPCVTREVRSGSRDGAETKIAIVRRTYGTDQADLWDALTNTDRIPRWFLRVSGNLEPGGRYQSTPTCGDSSDPAPSASAGTWP